MSSSARAQASFEVASAASRRAVKLLDETREMVRLKVVPEYQVYPAQYEVAVRRENEMAAVQAIGTASLRLAETLAAPVAVGTAIEAVSGTPTVVVWAEGDVPAVGAAADQGAVGARAPGATCRGARTPPGWRFAGIRKV